MIKDFYDHETLADGTEIWLVPLVTPGYARIEVITFNGMMSY